MPGWGTTGLMPWGIGDTCDLAEASAALDCGRMGCAVGCGTTGLIPAEAVVYVELVAEFRVAWDEDAFAA